MLIQVSRPAADTGLGLTKFLLLMTNHKKKQTYIRKYIWTEVETLTQKSHKSNRK